MDVVNDSGLTVGWFVGRVPPHRLSATLLVKGTFELRHDATAVPVPPDTQGELSGDLHRDGDPSRSLIYASDFALFKPRTDVLLSGACHAPGGRPTSALSVGFRVGKWSKKLTVIGDRVWKPGLLTSAMSAPAPFKSLDLDWERAYGGPGFGANPCGRGFAEEDVPGVGQVRRLPNIEHPDRLVTGPGERTEPSCFAPIPLMWPQRLAKAGTFDNQWLKESWPWFPSDADWTIFNAAPHDQQLPGYLAGDETVALENLHPSVPLLTSRLPGLRVRWFVREISGEQSRVLEVPMHLDTLFVAADPLRLLLVWRGVMPVRSKQLKEVADQYIVTEPLSSTAPSLEHYAERLRVRKAEIEKARKGETVEVPPLTPLNIETPSTDWADEMDREELAAKAEVEKLVAQAAQRKEELRAALVKAGVDPSPLDQPPVQFPNTADAYYQLFKTAYEQLQREAPHIAASVPPPRPEEFVIEPPKGVPPLPPLPSETDVKGDAWTRERCIVHAADRGSFAELDLTGLDLSGLDLRGLDFRAVVLQNARLDAANLEGADLSTAILSKADLTMAVLRRTVLREADLSECVLSHADLSGAILDGADLTKAKLDGASVAGASAEEAIFMEADLSAADFQGAKLSLADFDASTLAGADFSRAIPRSASMDKAQGPGARMMGADLTGLKAAGATFTGGAFGSVRGADSVWEAAVLDGADFSRSDLSRANFEAASLKKTSFRSCELRNARLPEARLEGADFTGANLFHGTLESASLSRASFRRANLYEVEFYEAHGEGTDFDGANLKGTKLA